MNERLLTAEATAVSHHLKISYGVSYSIMAEFEKAEPLRAKNGRFENPWSTWQGLPNMKEFFKWVVTRKERCAKANLEEELPIVTPDFAVEEKNLRAIWLGHATVLVQMERMCILTDPCFSPKCSPISIFGPRRIRPPPCSLDDLRKVDAVLISHNHYDHLDSASVEKLNARFGATLKCWAVIGARHRFYFAGDTGYCSAFASIGHFYGPFTLAAIPIGCYKPRSFMKSQHICPGEAVKIHLDVKAENSIGIHWGTYDMGSTEDYLAPKYELIDEVKKADLHSDAFITLKHGETWAHVQ